MNSFQSISSGAGMLKNAYETDSKSKAMDEALKKKRKSLEESYLGESTTDNEPEKDK